MTATLTAILQETPPALSTLDPEIPPALDRVVMRVSRRPDERFQSAHELGLALDAVLKAPAGASWLTEVEERNPYPGLQSFTEKDAGASSVGKTRSRRCGSGSSIAAFSR